jgi:drug/metabolite transporter (DMT)-like permease
VEHIWIPLTIAAALMQALRTAAQKTLNATMSTMGTTYVRSLLGLPFIAIFLIALLSFRGGGVPDFGAEFMLYVFGGALTQVLATALLIRIFTLKSFAVGTMLTKTDILMTAVIGSVFFSERLTGLGWTALLVVFAGILMMLAGRLGPRARTAGDGGFAEVSGGPATRVALLCALMFTLSYLCFREATLKLGPGDCLWRGTWTVLVTLLMQTLFLGIWLRMREPIVFRQLWPNRGIITFIGFTSALGSIGWFAAFALQNASYVRAVGQIEAVFTCAISWIYFRVTITRLELSGMAAMLAGVLMFRLVQ